MARFETPLFLGVFLAICIAAFLGVSLDRIVYYPMQASGASSGPVFVSSLGVYVVVENFIALGFGNDVRSIANSAHSTFEIGSVILTTIQVVGIATAFVLATAVVLLLRTTAIGRQLRAMADNAELVDVFGGDTRAIRLAAFGIGSGFAGCAACLSAFDVGVTPAGGMDMLLIAAVAVIIGTARSFEGGIFGALAVGITQSLVIWLTSARWAQAATFVLVAMVLLVRREGLLTTGRRAEEL